ncbi:hypothetical protein D7X94_05030 [Acutalibacter sp. 1XD8-33]|uniref:zf-TFIIB domain-containing protein n=1 Tax=Acutalibacter sp. 1XD8-33 TaxID=2320081 RepID=UPI000EA0BB64|nr:zf-TFIIB domain-containing protein [Acutalibacter sp. 1XD8-33]RKJ41166.1 hypothetical protein D7X94_05030 [Acutalibacter sp. 1XD8-33]
MWYQRFQRFLYGRYGTDTLNIALLILGVVFTLFGVLFFWPLTFLADGIYIYALFRTFSRNIAARQREYTAFLKLWNPVSFWFRTEKLKFSQRKTYKYFKCPSCRQQLRAPRGRGNIEVTCQKCHAVFRTKT